MTITKERLLKIQHWRETYGADSNVMLPAEEAAELARIALASLDAEPVGEVSDKRHGLVMDGTVDLGGKSTYRIIKGEKAMKRLPLGTKFYIAPPAPVVPDGLRQALSNAGIAAPESDEMLAATCEKYIQMLVTWVKDRKPFQPAPVVPEEIEPDSNNTYDYVNGWNACRAAMLQSKYRDLSQPVDPQISEYEKIMLQAGMRQEPVAFLNYSGTIMTVGSYGFNLEPGKLLPLYAAPYFKTARESGSQQNARENKSVNYPAHIASKLERLGGMFSLELLLTDFADELVKDGNKFEASILRNAAECINKINQEGRNDNKQNTE